MKTNIWIIWSCKDVETEEGNLEFSWDVFDLCLSKQAAQKSLQKARQDFPNDNFYITEKIAHD